MDKGKLRDQGGRNYFSITAGDYNNDGKETVVVYACLDGTNYGLYEFSYSGGQFHQINSTADQTLLNPAYISSSTVTQDGIDGNHYFGSKLKGTVVTGDINNDGIDDLIVASERGYIGGSESGADAGNNQQEREAYVAVSFGAASMSGSPVAKCDTATYISDNGVSLTSTSADVGMIFADGDGGLSNKLTISGTKITKDDSGVYQQGDSSNKTTTASYFYEIINGQLKQINSRYDNQTGLDGTIDSSQEACLYPVPVCSAYIDGSGQQEYLFINGSIYQFQSDGTITCVDSPISGSAYLYEAMPISVDDNGHGIEQFGVSLMANGTDGDGYFINKALCHIIYGNASYDGNGTLTKSSAFATDSGAVTFESAIQDGSLSGNTNQLITPYENSYSGVMRVRLNNKGYFYSNPEPVAVLQPAPYFEETGDEYSGSTEYSMTTSYEVGGSTGTDTSVGVGFSEEFELGEALHQSFNKKYKNYVSDEFEKSSSQEYTTTFATEDEATVVIQSTPVVYYSYDTMNSDGSWKTNSMGVTVAQIPVYTQITVEQYNDFVDYYNQYIVNNPKTYVYNSQTTNVVVAPLNKIDEDQYYLDCIGKPDSYANAWDILPNGQRSSKGTMALSYHGGDSSCDYDQDSDEKQTHTIGRSVDYSLDILVGGGLGEIASAWVGGSYDSDTGSSNSSFTTSGNGNAISGTVKNLDTDSLTKSGQFDENSVTSYYFEWTFGLCDFKAHSGDSDDKNIPVACYVVNKVSRGLEAPVPVSVEETAEKTLMFSWSAPTLSDGHSIDGYNVYVGDIDDDFKKVTDDFVSADCLSYEFTPEEGIEYYSFVVTAVGKTTPEQTSSIESLPSSKKEAIIYDYEKKTVYVSVKGKTISYGDTLTYSADDLIFPDGTDETAIDMSNLKWGVSYKTGSQAGNYIACPYGLTSKKYSFNYGIGEITVEPKVINPSDILIETASKVYDGTTDAIGKLWIKDGVILNNDNVRLGYNKPQFDNESVSDNHIVTYTGLELLGSKANNYNLQSYSVSTPATIKITKALINASDITAAAENKVYDGTLDATGELQINNSVIYNNDDVTLTYKKAAFDNKNASDNHIVTFTDVELAGTKANNYDLKSDSVSTTATVKITKAPLTVTADDKEIIYGADVPEYTVKYKTIGDDKLNGTLSLNCVYKKYSDIGIYDITPSGLTSDNYDITFKKGTLTVSTAPLNLADIRLSDSSFVYDTEEHKPMVAVAVNNMDIPESAYTVTYKNNIEPGEATVIIKAKVDNRYISGSAEKTFTILEKPAPSVAPEPESKPYPDKEVNPLTNNGWGDIVDEDKSVIDPKEVTEDSVNIIGVEDVTYTGSAITFDIRVYKGTNLLREGTDYTVKYLNNKAVCEDLMSTKTPTVKIIGKGTYKNTKFEDQKFKINSINLEESTATVVNITAAYRKNGKFKPVPTVMLDGKRLWNNRDFKLTYKDTNNNAVNYYTEPGTYKVKIEGINNYKGSLVSTYYLVDTTVDGLVLMNSVSVKGLKTSVAYTGKAITIDDIKDASKFAVTARTSKGAESLEAGTDYEVTAVNNVSVGTASLVFKAKDGNTKRLVGEKTVTFKITGTALSKTNIVLKNASGAVSTSFDYTGSEIKPVVVITTKGSNPATLKEGTDYTVEYQKNINAGKAIVIIKGINAYTGTDKKIFTIKAIDFSKASLSNNADGKASIEVEPLGTVTIAKNSSGKYIPCNPKPVIKFNGKLLIEGKDYTLRYGYNSKPALSTDKKAPIVVIKGTGNFANTILKTFSITEENS